MMEQPAFSASLSASGSKPAQDDAGNEGLRHPATNLHPTEYERELNEDDRSRASGQPADDEGQKQEPAIGMPV